MTRSVSLWKTNLSWVVGLGLTLGSWGIPFPVTGQSDPALNQLYDLDRNRDTFVDHLSFSSDGTSASRQIRFSASGNLSNQQRNRVPHTERVQVAPIADPPSEFLTLIRNEGGAFPTSESYVLTDVYFDAQRTAIGGDAALAIQKGTELVRGERRARLSIEAHCDQRGNEAYNLVLGDRRAARVGEYVLALGLSPEQMVATTYGELAPQCRDHHQSCFEDNLRLQYAFQFLAISKPRLGCLTRLRVFSNRFPQLKEHPASQQPFLQRIRLADTNPMVRGMRRDGMEND